MQSSYSDTPPVTAIVSDDYRVDHDNLIHDAIIHQMVAELLDGILNKGIDPVAVGFITPNTEGGTATFQFMRACTDRYRALGGTHGQSIGAVARAVWALVLPGLDAQATA